MKTAVRRWGVLLLLPGFLALSISDVANTALAQSGRRPYSESVARLLSGVDEEMVEEFKKAWRYSRNVPEVLEGAEGVILIYDMVEGGYKGRLQEETNGPKQSSFRWDSNVVAQVSFQWRSNAVAIVYTHPESSDPKPSGNDRRVAERLKVPIFTITTKGMYVYDPETRKTTMVLDGLDWLDSSKWKAMLSFGGPGSRDLTRE
jgi:hypothetical protein